MKLLSKKTIGVALAAALPIEAAVFFLLPFPIDIGYAPGTPWYVQLMGLPWIVLHLAGMLCINWIERISGCGNSNVAGGCGHVDTIELFASGYLTAALLLIPVILLLQRIWRGKDEGVDLE